MRFAIKDAANITLCTRSTKEPIFFSRDLNTFNVKLEGESVYAKAKGDNAIAFDGALTGTVTMEAEVVQFEQLAVILSSTVVQESARVGERKVLLADDAKKVTLEGIIPVKGSISVFSLEKDKITNVELLNFTTSTAGVNTEITITSPNFTAGENVAVFYLKEIPKAKKIVVKDQSTAPNYTIYGDAMAKNDEGEYLALALTIPNCKAQRSIEMGFTAENPSNFSTTLDILPDENGEFLTLAFIEDGVDPATFDAPKSINGVEVDYSGK
ncbi:hypothetical protein [Metaclostridioides mangenotii]|jgi:hypothetical protein|uniref:hypothetical protein n=1 Tax=Metaclostridioides mangenotii TaxID=1540 RepID=UPI000483BEAA|nr:hypothetical protein [Clostridioides mangenotii]